MTNKRYRQIRAGVALFIGAIVSISVTENSYVLATIAVVTGMLFLLLVKSKTKLVVDERDKVIREKAANLTYAIFTPTLGLGAFIMSMIGRNPNTNLGSLGMTLSYLTLFLITIYSFSYYLISRKLGGGGSEE